jgi:hypothetical protein
MDIFLSKGFENQESGWQEPGRPPFPQRFSSDSHKAHQAHKGFCGFTRRGVARNAPTMNHPTKPTKPTKIFCLQNQSKRPDSWLLKSC